jgi:hypothetical protein
MKLVSPRINLSETVPRPSISLNNLTALIPILHHLIRMTLRRKRKTRQSRQTLKSLGRTALATRQALFRQEMPSRN